MSIHAMADDDPESDPGKKRDIPLDADLLFTKYEDQKRAAQKALDKIEELEQHTYKLRKEKKELKNKVPDEGAVVLSPEEADDLRELGALGEDGEVQADKVSERLSDAEEAEQKLQKYERQEQRRKVYEATGLNAEAAEDILPDDVEYETETVEGEDGEETEAYVVTDDGRTPVGDYIEEKYSEPIQNALYAGSEDTGEDDSGGPSVPEQTPSGEDTPGPDEPDEEEQKQKQDEDVGYTL